MKFRNGMNIIKEVLDSYNEYDILPNGSDQLIERLISDLKYERKIKEATLEHFRDCFPHLFEGKSEG